MAREITDDEIKEWMQLLTEQETMEFFDGINMRAALLIHCQAKVNTKQGLFYDKSRNINKFI